MLEPALPPESSALCASGMDLEGRSAGKAAYTGTSFAASRMARFCARGSTLVNVSFVGCSLEQSIFIECDLRGADFKGADLRGALFARCDLRGVSGLADAEGLGEAIFWESSLSPEGRVIAALSGVELDKEDYDYDNDIERGWPRYLYRLPPPPWPT